MLRLVAAPLIFALFMTSLAAAETLRVDGGVAQHFVVVVSHTPEAPTDLQAEMEPGGSASGRYTATVQGGVHLSWQENDPAEGVSNYRIYRNDAFGDEFERIGRSDGASYTDHGVEDGENYVYFVTAVNEVGESEASNKASVSLPVECDEAAEDDGCTQVDLVTPETEGPSDEWAVEDRTPTVEPTIAETTEPTATSTPADPTATPGDEGADSAGGD